MQQLLFHQIRVVQGVTFVFQSLLGKGLKMIVLYILRYILILFL